ncbi:MAG: sugar ABC transporter permease [Anaerolineales bacterium]|nr:sugar ABC transporter permease [Anaerolineales bacterium]
MDRKTFFQFTAPSNLVMLALMVFPLAIAVWFGLHYMTFSNIQHPEFIGLDNFTEILGDPKFWQAFLWTLEIIAITVPAQLVIGFLVALLLDQVTGRLRSLFLAALLLPMVVVPVVGTIVFKQLFEPSGLVAWFYRTVFSQPFIFNELSMKVVILIHTTWLNTPFVLVIFFAGLQTLPPELTEAAAIDGAGRLQQIRHIVIPHLQTLAVLTGLISVMDTFRLFDNVFVLTRQNPIFNADTILTYNFRVAMAVQQLGRGNAVAILTVIAILIVLIPFLYYTYREQIEQA